MVGAVTLLGHVQRNETALITATQNVDADGRILFFEFWYVFYGQRKGKARNVHGVFIGFVVGESIWVMCSWMEGCQDGPDETFRVGGVFHINSTFFLGQPLWCGNVTRTVQGTILGYTEDELGDVLENEATAASVPVASLCREVGDNML